MPSKKQTDMFPFPPAIPAIPVSLASQTSLKAAMPDACMAANFCGNASRKAPRFALSPSWSAAALSLHLCKVLRRCKHSALYCSLSLSISYRIFIKFFLEVGGFSLPLLPCSLNLVCFLQISMTASTQRSVFRMCRVFPPATYSIKCPSTGSKQPSKKEKENEHESLEKRFVSRLGSCLRPDIAQRLSADRRPHLQSPPLPVKGAMSLPPTHGA